MPQYCNAVVLRRRRVVEVVEERVVLRVEEELRAAAVGGARVGHRDRADLVRQLADELVRDVAAAITLHFRAVGERELGVAGRAARAGNRRLGVGRVRAPAGRPVRLRHYHMRTPERARTGT